MSSEVESEIREAARGLGMVDRVELEAAQKERDEARQDLEEVRDNYHKDIASYGSRNAEMGKELEITKDTLETMSRRLQDAMDRKKRDDEEFHAAEQERDEAREKLEIAREALRLISEDTGDGFNSVNCAVDALMKIGEVK